MLPVDQKEFFSCATTKLSPNIIFTFEKKQKQPDSSKDAKDLHNPEEENQH